METVGSRIKNRRKQIKMSADKLGEMIGKNRATVYRYESDEIENMPYDIILPISKALNVSPSYLLGWDEEETVKQPSTSYGFIPVPVAAGNPFTIDGVENIESIEIPDVLLGKWAGCKKIFFMKVNGESMNKVLPNQTLIAVKKIELNDIKNGDIVVFSNDQEYSVKRMYRYEDKIIFRPDSTDPIFSDYVVSLEEVSHLQIHGKVVTYIVNLD